MTRDEEVAWAAGLFEGEGCWSIQRQTSKHPMPRAVLVMTDEATVREFSRIVGVGSVHMSDIRPPRKPGWRWNTTNIPDFLAVAYLLGPYMHTRRREALVACINAVPPPKPVGVKNGGRFWATANVA